MRTIELEGVLLDGETSIARPSLLTVELDGTVRLDVEGVTSRLSLAELGIPARLGTTVRRIRLPAGGVFETHDNDGVDEVIRFHGAGHRNLVHRLESRMLTVAASVLVVAVVGVAFVFFGVPALAERIAFSLSPEASGYIGQGTLELLDELMEPSELLDADKARLRARFDALATDAPPGHAFALEFRRGAGFGANAFALPSGTVVLTDELVELAEHEDEIVAVLAHEVGHVVHRHGLRQVIQSSALLVAIVLVTGDLSSTSGFVAAVPTLLVETRFSREFEREADAYAVEVLDERGIPTRHFAAILRRLGEAHGGDGSEALGGYLSSHPATDERIAGLSRESP